MEYLPQTGGESIRAQNTLDRKNDANTMLRAGIEHGTPPKILVSACTIYLNSHTITGPLYPAECRLRETGRFIESRNSHACSR